jgi:hypothetical protein
MADSPYRRLEHDEEEGPQQRFGTATWVWTIASALIILVMIVMLVMSIFGYWESDWIAPPV